MPEIRSVASGAAQAASTGNTFILAVTEGNMINRYWTILIVPAIAAGLLTAMAFTLEPTAQSGTLAAGDRCRLQANLGGRESTVAADAVHPGALDAQLAARVTLLRDARLTVDQASVVERIMKEHDGYDLEVTGSILAEHATLLALAGESIPDPQRIGASYAAIGKMQRRMVEADVAFWNRIYALLDTGQKQHLQTACGENVNRVARAPGAARAS
jgi:hypothetical protein